MTQAPADGRRDDRVPLGAVAVMGFDNWQVLTAGSRPHLTSVDMNLEQVGRVAAQALFTAISGTGRSGIETLPCRVVIRGSTAPLS
ncbi:substrate-binding domain-containing protein [Streptomyces adelaidensis]|uniref:substrate-binding domain-containing protein n=1 Tax=Streptomyces adelaidensis TaxID=2796465 RepID=UPI0027DDF1EF|nr:substrate-binding domain-containing protein [Streptomyces adelaidensis]